MANVNSGKSFCCKSIVDFYSKFAILSDDTHNDLAKIKQYIPEEPGNPQAPAAPVERITNEIRRLQTYSLTGTPLSSVSTVNSHDRFLVSGNYVVFYRTAGTDVFVDRVLYGRRDSLRSCFPICQDPKPTNKRGTAVDHVTIRPATLADAGNILEIYAYYVQNTAITFEYKIPSLEEFRGRMENTLRKYPYLVAVRDGKIAGYAYAGAFVGRAAYDWSAEMTVYLDHNARKRGLGRTLYTALEDALRDMGVLNLYACIGYPEEEDEYLTQNSAGFHTHLGFELVGRFHRCGYKFGRWYDMVWMEKVIGEHRAVQPGIRRFSALKR